MPSLLNSPSTLLLEVSSSFPLVVFSFNCTQSVLSSSSFFFHGLVVPALQYVNVKFPNVIFDPKDRTLVNNFIKQFTAELAFASKVDASRFYIYKLDNIAGLIVDLIVAPPSKEEAAAFKAGTGKNPRSASDIFIDIREQAKWGTSVLRYPRATPVANVWGGQMTATDAVLQKCAFTHNPPYMPDCDNLPCTEDCSDGFSDLVMIIGIVGASLCVIGLLIVAKKMKSHGSFLAAIVLFAVV